jgi:spore germination cell wall hydrolase CwlJ-like protein
VKFITTLILLSQLASADTTLRVAQTIYAEAKGESLAGKKAVASVIFNRASDVVTRNRTTWSKALNRTCQAPAFSCWMKYPKAPDYRKPSERQAWRDSYRLASEIVNGSFVPTVSSRHYAEHTIRNYWTRSMPLLARIDSHNFYGRK